MSLRFPDRTELSVAQDELDAASPAPLGDRLAAAMEEDALTDVPEPEPLPTPNAFPCPHDCGRGPWRNAGGVAAHLRQWCPNIDYSWDKGKEPGRNGKRGSGVATPPPESEPSNDESEYVEPMRSMDEIQGLFTYLQQREADRKQNEHHAELRILRWVLLK